MSNIQMKSNAVRFLSLLLLSGLFVACAPKKTLPGKRISVVDLEKKLRVSKNVKQKKVILPSARKNKDWPQLGLTPTHLPRHLALGKKVRVVRKAFIGEASNAPFMFQPIIANNILFVLDGNSQLQAFDLKKQKHLWKKDLYEDSAFGASLAYDRGRLFVATGGGKLLSLSAANGSTLWEDDTGLVYRAAPVVYQGKVFFMSFNNKLTVRNSFSGKEIWNHSGVSEPSSVLMSSAVAVNNEVVIVPYNSGEIFALRHEGREFVWADSLLRQGLRASSSNTGFVAPPVVDGGIVYLVSNADYITAIDLGNGAKLWSQYVSGVNMPWLTEEHIFVLSQQGDLLCLEKETGRLLWQRKLEQTGTWFGPVLAGGRLWLSSSIGKLAEVSPHNGKVLSNRLLSEGFRTPPVVANGRIYLVSNKMELFELAGK